MRRALIPAAVALALVLPASAFGHAVLERSEPVRGASPASSPERVALHFNEPVEASFGAIRVFDTAGDQVETGAIERPQSVNDAIAATLPGDLPDGGYTVTYRVISADSHPVSGGFVFSVGEGGAAPARTVSELLEGSDAGTATSVAFWAARWAGYVALGLAVGIAGFAMLVWTRARARTWREGPEWIEASAAFARRFRHVAGAVAVAGLVASIAALVLQGATAAGTSFWSALDPDAIGEVLDTRYGTLAALRAGAFALFGALAVTRLPNVLLAAPLGFLALAPALAGHASTQDPTALLIPANVAHALAMGLWFGGLCAALVLLPAATRRLEPAARSSLLAASLERFSPIALGAVLVLAVSGTVQAIVYLGPLSELVEIGFGRAISIKALLLLGLVGIGALHRRRLLPALDRVVERRESPGRAGVILRRALRAEVALIVAALGVTAALVSYQPPAQAGAGPVSGSAEVGDALLEYTVDPAEPGPNEMHLYLFDAADGSQYTAAKEVRASLELPAREIGPIEAELERSGPGHYVAPGAAFGVGGEWTVEISVRVSRFEQSETSFEVPVK